MMWHPPPQPPNNSSSSSSAADASWEDLLDSGQLDSQLQRLHVSKSTQPPPGVNNNLNNYRPHGPAPHSRGAAGGPHFHPPPQPGSYPRPPSLFAHPPPPMGHPMPPAHQSSMGGVNGGGGGGIMLLTRPSSGGGNGGGPAHFQRRPPPSNHFSMPPPPHLMSQPMQPQPQPLQQKLSPQSQSQPQLAAPVQVQVQTDTTRSLISQPPTGPKMTILKRPSSTPNNLSAQGADKNKHKKTLKQREEDYAKARLRILGSAESEPASSGNNNNNNSSGSAADDSAATQQQQPPRFKIDKGKDDTVVLRSPKGPDGTGGFRK